ncbi:carbohydrate-binding module family 21 protein [Dichotomopilus funicola]|uniref:Carbohydrate-binding module family 21 protein n=1 Tax=Dichotomopilus funicola TaxID=1934379 RepID=A0AAN6ZLS8_9PEZI|nr:carbohydrate-binding module family 21 protein [Dichotomopilus funicola]
MPYTPPQRSPASSGPPSPDGSRRPSFHQPPNSNARPALPRSASYLTKHRRSPSAQARGSQLSPEATSEDLKSLAAGSSLRQSPPPITAVRGIPNAAIISPPDSASDDDEQPEVRGRQIDNIKELHAAISQIPQQRNRVPAGAAPGTEASDAGDLLVLPTQANAMTEAVHHNFSTGSLSELKVGGTRRYTHTRSATEPHITISKSSASSSTGSEEDTDEERRRKPQMVRKKSGELVRPALRPASRRRPSSMPGTPTFSKVVHFDSHLEHVRHFLQVDRPLAVSAGSSPVDNYDSDAEYPFSTESRSSTRTSSFEWEIIMNNFPVDTPVRKMQPVRLERVWLSADQKSLVGSIAVANLAFQKFVACRFTLDYWKTTSEVTAEYVNEIRGDDTTQAQDRFNFTIKLSDLANLEAKTLYFCLRYTVNGQEYWDNNNGINFQVDFRKKLVPQPGKPGSAGAASRSSNGLPKSNRRSSPKAKPSRGRSDEFGENQKPVDKAIHDYLGETSGTGLRLKGVKSSSDIPSDNLSKGLTGPSGQFALRYDFGNSLSRAIQGAKNEMSGKSDGLYMKQRNKSVGSPTAAPVVAEKKVEPASAPKSEPPKAAPISTSPTDSPSAAMSSASYEEIVNKWCFYGTKPKTASPQTQSKVPKFEIGDDSSSSTASYDGSPVQLSNPYHSYGGAPHHSVHPLGPSPYFVHVPILKAMGASPVDSPSENPASPVSGQPNTKVSSHAVPGIFAPFGTSPNDYLYECPHDRFPFYGPETYGPAAIKS